MRPLDRFLTVAALSLIALTAHAQNTQPVPDAPIPSAPAPKPLLAAPTPTYEVPKSHASDLPDNTFCHAEAEGLFTKSNQHWPIAMQGVMNAYVRNAMTLVKSQWIHHMSIGERNAWATGKHLSVRFAIFPDGTHSAPEVTVSSRHPNDDEHAVAAVRYVGTFDPLPSAITHPVAVCINFQYNSNPWEENLPDPLAHPPVSATPDTANPN
ncbi:MAG: hypothetical protein V4555_00345 [Acidobacteriota bacterium]